MLSIILSIFFKYTKRWYLNVPKKLSLTYDIILLIKNSSCKTLNVSFITRLNLIIFFVNVLLKLSWFIKLVDKK